MALSYAEIQARALQYLQATTTKYTDAQLEPWIEDELTRMSKYAPHIVEIRFKVESRKGVATATLASNLVDTTKGQFIASDHTLEKVVHNITDDTWGIVLAYVDADTLTLGSDIFVVNDVYEIYNRHCRNKREIYIGDMPRYLWIDSVQYPIGTERNFVVRDDVLELDVEDDAIQDSDSTLDPLSQVDVLIRFAFPHVLPNLTDWTGAVSTAVVAAATAMSIDAMAGAETIKTGVHFFIEDHHTDYVVANDATLSASAGIITFYPGLEKVAANDKIVTFRKSTLQPQHEEILTRMVAHRAVASDTLNYINKANVGGANTWADYMQWKRDLDMSIQRDLVKLAKPKAYKELPRT